MPYNFGCVPYTHEGRLGANMSAQELSRMDIQIKQITVSQGMETTVRISQTEKQTMRWYRLCCTTVAAGFPSRKRPGIFHGENGAQKVTKGQVWESACSCVITSDGSRHEVCDLF